MLRQLLHAGTVLHLGSFLGTLTTLRASGFHPQVKSFVAEATLLLRWRSLEKEFGATGLRDFKGGHLPPPKRPRVSGFKGFLRLRTLLCLNSGFGVGGGFSLNPKP